MHANGFAHIDMRISDSARDAVRGNATAARSLVSTSEARLDSFYQGVSANGNGDLDLSAVSSDFGANAEQKVKAYVELASKLHGANAALHELEDIARQLHRPPVERTIANGGITPAPRLSDLVTRANGGRLSFNPAGHSIVELPAMPVATLFQDYGRATHRSINAPATSKTPQPHHSTCWQQCGSKPQRRMPWPT